MGPKDTRRDILETNFLLFIETECGTAKRSPAESIKLDTGIHKAHPLLGLESGRKESGPQLPLMVGSPPECAREGIRCR